MKTGAKKEMRVAVNMPDDLYAVAVQRAKEQERSLAGYFRHLVRKDTGVDEKQEAAAV